MNKIKNLLYKEAQIIVIALLCIGLALLVHILKPSQQPTLLTPITQEQTIGTTPLIPTPKPITTEKPTPTDEQGIIIGTDITYNNILNSTNAMRKEIGLPILKVNTQLNAVAKTRLNAILSCEEIYKGDIRKCFAPTDPYTGKKFNQYFPDTFNLSYKGENLARYFLSLQPILETWKESPTHYANIIKKEYTDTGIAIYGTYVVQEFTGASN